MIKILLVVDEDDIDFAKYIKEAIKSVYTSKAFEEDPDLKIIRFVCDCAIKTWAGINYDQNIRKYKPNPFKRKEIEFILSLFNPQGGLFKK